MNDQSKKILIVDDDPEILELLSDWLKQRGYLVDEATCCKAMQECLETQANTYAVVLLDVMLPDGDGIEMCKEVTQAHPQLPVVLMTANNVESDRVLGLEFGADDYIQKPFNLRELLARLKAIFRRVENSAAAKPYSLEVLTSGFTEKTFEFNGWKLNTGSRALVDPNGLDVSLTSGVYDILLIFLEHPKRVLSRDFLMDLTQNRLAESYDRSIDVQVSRLRQKLDDDPNAPTLIKTIRNGGYMFTADIKKS